MARSRNGYCAQLYDRATLDSQLRATGKYIENCQAQPITASYDDIFWNLHLLEERSQVLLDTIVRDLLYLC